MQCQDALATVAPLPASGEAFAMCGQVWVCFCAPSSYVPEHGEVVNIVKRILPLS